MNWRRYFTEVIGIMVGSTVAGIGINMFLIPNRLAAGGVSGLGIILFHTFNIPVGLTILAVNIPLFVLAYRYLGKRFFFHSLVGAIVFPFMIEAFAFLPAATDDLLLASVYGGLVLGIGLGIVFRYQGSTGGTATAAKLLHRFLGITTGEGLLGSDLVILAVAGLTFGAELGLYAAISLVVGSWVIDVVQEGLSAAKNAFIITEHAAAINEKILGELRRGATLLEGWGGYSGKRKGILMCVVNRNEISRLKAIIYEADPDAFLVVGNAYEVLGEGFRHMEAPS